MFTVDHYSADHVLGWLTGKDRSVTIAINGAEIGRAAIGFPRPDVAKAYPNAPNAAQSGFRYVFQRHEVQPGKNFISIYATGDGLKIEWKGEIAGYSPPSSFGRT